MQLHWSMIILIYVGIVLWLIIPNVKELTPKSTLGVLLFPIVVPAWLIWAGMYHYFLQEFQFRKEMKVSDRLLPRSTTPSSGSIIVDFAAFNHCRTRVWWTPDDIPAIAPVPMKDDSEGWPEDKDKDIFIWPRFDRWLWDQYLNPDSGSAKLIFCKLSSVPIEKMKVRYPNCKVVNSNSAGRILQKYFPPPDDERNN